MYVLIKIKTLQQLSVKAYCIEIFVSLEPQISSVQEQSFKT